MLNIADKVAEYRDRARRARQEAQEATLRTQREAFLRSAATWEEKAMQLERIEQMKNKNDAP